MSNAFEGKRLADDGIYLNESRVTEPKEIWKVMAAIIAEAAEAPGRVLDVGCATGEFIAYLLSQFPTASYTGIDISENMIVDAREKQPGVRFEVGSILDERLFAERAFDTVVCNGTVQIFDDLEPPLVNLLSCLAPGGFLFVHTLANTEPVDLLTRYRRVDAGKMDWETGWNVFSTATFERIMADTGFDLTWSWRPFRMPFAIPKRDDPLRAYTIETADNPYQQVNGLGLLVNTQILVVQRGEK